MPLQFHEENSGILVVHVSGKLTTADFEHLEPEIERLFRQHGNLRVLYDMTDFHGWDLGALWEGTVFKIKHAADIERIERCAMVGEKKWQQIMAALCKPFTKAKIRYFDHAELAKAREWLGAGLQLQMEQAK